MCGALARVCPELAWGAGLGKYYLNIEVSQ